MKDRAAGDWNGMNRATGVATLLPLPGERAGVRADVVSNSSPPANDFTIWQLADSAFPTGGFAHSAGLEAAWQLGEVRDRDELISFVGAALSQLGHAVLPFVTAAFEAPDRLDEFDRLCDAFTTNHVANRASRAQGRALLTAVQRAFMEHGLQAASSCEAQSVSKRTSGRAPLTPPCAHLATVFGALMARLALSRQTTLRLFFFSHLRGLLAAAVRLNIVGPLEAQTLQRRLVVQAEGILTRCQSRTLDEIAQTSPLLDVWQSAQDRLYSRLFQS